MQYLNLGQKYDKIQVFNDQTVFTRLFSEEDEFESYFLQSENEGTQNTKENSVILKEKLENANQIKKKVMKCSNNVNCSLKKIVKQELQLFDSTTYHSLNIIKLAQVLTLIPFLSVEFERAFSAVGLFITKLRTKLIDKSIDCLCFLDHISKINKLLKIAKHT